MSLEDRLAKLREEAERQKSILAEVSSLEDKSNSADFLRKELVRHLYEARELSKEWRHALDEVRRLGYDHKEAGTQQMVLKCAALELQALCGLAALKGRED